jgi:4-hydroxythreonine-4-phosphate dehydrogenase
MKSRIRLAVTLGDPAGVGPEVILKSLPVVGEKVDADILILGHRAFLSETADALGLGDAPPTVAAPEERMRGAAVLEVGPLGNEAIRPGEVSAAAGQLSVGYIRKAIELARTGAVDAIVTAPIHKEAIFRAGHHFPGHTELLARETNTRRFAMMLVGGPLRVSFVTTHVALRRLFSLITRDNILNTVRITQEGLQAYFDLPSPRIGVCGLNPHASDGGRFGDEEAKVIRPAVEEACRKGVECSGPLSPDTAFYYAAQGRYDALVSLYHDQGSIPLKLLAFESGVNVTLGLPIIRTSVDHGTAFDIVRQNRASPGSLIEAITLAASMAARKRAR